MEWTAWTVVLILVVCGIDIGVGWVLLGLRKQAARTSAPLQPVRKPAVKERVDTDYGDSWAGS